MNDSMQNHTGQSSPGTKPVVILVLGLVSLFLIQLLGPVAWFMGNRRLKTMGPGAHQRGFVVAGRIMGMIATALFVLSILGLFFGLIPGI